MARLSDEAMQNLTASPTSEPRQSQGPEPFTLEIPRHKRERIEQLMLILKDFDAVAEEMGLSKEEVEAHYSDIKKSWNRRRMINRTDRIDEELAQLEKLRSMALDHYERSRERAVESSREKIIEPPEQIFTTGHDGQVTAMPTFRGSKIVAKVVRKVKHRDGELGALKLAMEAGKEIRTLLGVDAVEVKRLEIDRRTTITDSGQLAQLDAAQLAELHRSAIEQSFAAQ